MKLLRRLLAPVMWAYRQISSSTNERDRRLVLVVLADGPSYGLRVDDAVRRRFDVSLGHGVYPILRQLEREGVLRSYEQRDPDADASRGGRPRVYYEIQRRTS